MANQLTKQSLAKGSKKKPRLEVKASNQAPDEAHFDYIPPSDTSQFPHIFYNNPNSTPATITAPPLQSRIFIPPKSTVLQGDIFQTMPLFVSSAPSFNLITMGMHPFPMLNSHAFKEVRGCETCIVRCFASHKTYHILHPPPRSEEFPHNDLGVRLTI